MTYSGCVRSFPRGPWWCIAYVVFALWCCVADQAEARSRWVTVPVNVGVAPAGYLVSGLFQDQPVHFGLKIYVTAVLDRKTIRRFRRRIPRQYRQMAMRQSEIRISPLILGLIPDSIIISPKIRNTQMYGVTFRPIGFGISLLNKPVRVSVSAGLLFTYAFIQSDTLFPDPMHFLRPGLDIKFDVEVPITDSFLMSVGWASQLYIPQRIGGSILEMGQDLNEWMWHFGQFYLMFHFRFPYTTRL